MPHPALGIDSVTKDRDRVSDIMEALHFGGVRIIEGSCHKSKIPRANSNLGCLAG